MAAPRLDFAIVGAQRAGSTQLNACVQDHPGVFLCPDEVPYFEDPFFPNTPESALEPVFAGARHGQRLGIQCPSYLCRVEAAARLKAHSPDAGIIVVLRDPVARAVSAYYWYVQYGMLPLEHFEVGAPKLLDGWADPAYPQANEILEWGRYGVHLERFVELFGRDRVLILLNDELDGAATFARVYEFLGVDPGHQPAPRDGRKNAGVYDLRRLRVLRARHRLAWSWAETTEYRYQPRRRRKPLRFLPNAAIVGLDRVVLARVFGNEPPKLPADLDTRLRRYYADDVRVAESMVGRDLTSWRQPRLDRI